MKTVLVTGAAGFIGYHLSRALLDEGFAVVGYDGMTEYYDVMLKRHRIDMLRTHGHFTGIEAMLEDRARLEVAFAQHRPEITVHLAAQAGVRYSIQAPETYFNSNLLGSFNLLECVRRHGTEHLLLGSTSSVYGSNETVPFGEGDMADHPLTFYAATKKANEAMAHSYSHLWHLPTTMFRFFTVYGPWGRPDMALFKFVRSILRDEPINIFNNGDMERDFTYIDDLVNSIRLLMDTVPPHPDDRSNPVKGDSLSPVAPYRVVNIGNAQPVQLLDFVEEVERSLNRKAIRNYMEMQLGDAQRTWAKADLLRELTGYQPNTPVAEGIRAFVAWYIDYYGVAPDRKSA
ncbi:MAG: NAD-dependent epimerase/dehydratase family protein [Pseudomonadota bacterium]